MGIGEINDMVARMKGGVQSFRGEFDRWQGGEVQALEGLKKGQDAAIAKGEQTVCGLMQRKTVLEREVQKVKSRCAVEQHDVDVMAAEVEELKAKHETLPPQVAEAQRVHDEEKSALDEATNQLDKLKVEQQAEMARLTHSVDFYSERLGLTLQNAGGSLSLDFTLIDPASPQKPHRLSVAVEEDTYSLVGVSPPVAHIERLVRDLNADNNFQAFVCSVRRSFKALYE